SDGILRLYEFKAIDGDTLPMMGFELEREVYTYFKSSPSVNYKLVKPSELRHHLSKLANPFSGTKLRIDMKTVTLVSIRNWHEKIGISRRTTFGAVLESNEDILSRYKTPNTVQKKWTDDL